MTYDDTTKCSLTTGAVTKILELINGKANKNVTTQYTLPTGSANWTKWNGIAYMATLNFPGLTLDDTLIVDVDVFATLGATNKPIDAIQTEWAKVIHCETQKDVFYLLSTTPIEVPLVINVRKL